METTGNKKNFVKITPAQGMWLYNGKVVSDSAYVPANSDTSKWREVTAEEKAEIERTMAEEAEKENE